MEYSAAPHLKCLLRFLGILLLIKTRVYEWYNCFQENRENVRIEQVKKMILKNQRSNFSAWNVWQQNVLANCWISTNICHVDIAKNLGRIVTSEYCLEVMHYLRDAKPLFCLNHRIWRTLGPSNFVLFVKQIQW